MEDPLGIRKSSTYPGMTLRSGGESKLLSEQNFKVTNSSCGEDFSQVEFVTGEGTERRQCI